MVVSPRVLIAELLINILRRRWVQAGLCLLAALVLFLGIRGWSTARDIEFRLRFEGAGPVWKVDWSPGLGVERNGHWVDFGLADQTRPALNTAGAHESIRVRLANYGVEDIALHWVEGPAGARVTVVEAFVDSTVLGLERLRVRAPLEPADARVRLPLTADAEGEGSLHFTCPPPPAWADAVTLGLCLGLSGGVWLAILVLVRAVPVYDRALDRCRRRECRWTFLTCLMWAAIFGVPLWMLAWSPVILSGDGTAYVLHALLVLQNGNFDHYDGWRLPGYALLIAPFLAAMKDYAAGVGCAQALLGVVPAIAAWGMLRGRVRAPWPQLAGLLVALDPMIFVWQRTVMTELQSCVLIMLAAWLVVCILDDPRARWRAVALGFVLASACFTRPNLQVLAFLAPLLLLAAAPRTRGWWAPGLLAAVVLAACLTPFIISNYRTFSRVGVVVGNDWNRAIWSWENRVLDWNQSGVLSHAQFREVHREVEAGTFYSWDLPDYVHQRGLLPADRGVHPWTQQDQRSGPLWRESAARRPDLFLRLLPRAVASMFGFRTHSPGYFHGDAQFVLGPLIGRGPHQFGTTTLLFDLNTFPQTTHPLFQRVEHELGDIGGSPHARVVDGMWRIARFLRQIGSLLFIFAVVRLLCHRRWALGGLGLVLLAHMVAVPVLVFSGNDRYAMPWYGLMTVVLVAGLVVRPAVLRTAPPSDR